MTEILTANAVFSTEEVEFKTFYQNGKNFIHFGFKNKFSYDSALRSTSAWKAHCNNDPSKKFVHIWDCQSMHGFDKSAKDLWMEYMETYYDQTEKIILIADNIVIRGAARIMSKFTKHNLSIYKTFSEMAEKEL